MRSLQRGPDIGTARVKASDGVEKFPPEWAESIAYNIPNPFCYTKIKTV